MKCFLSHSSKDKGHYVSLVADKLGSSVEYDEKTFEEGMGNLEEILKALDRTTVFVLFISDNSLESEWVKAEITQAKKLLDIGQLKRFFPLIIDPSIDHTDSRIPEWVKQNYNLRPITRPVVAAKRIRERMIEASWETHPMLKERDQIFVGRNDIIKTFEFRIDDFSKNQPIVVFASGLNEIGRKSTMRHALKKSNITRETYEPIHLSLDRDDGLEGLILKIYDIGLSSHLDVRGLLRKEVGEKTDILAKLIDEISSHNEVLLIDDRYCIVRFEREIAPWFQDAIKKLRTDRLAICVACSARPAKYLYVREDELFFIEVPELERPERIGLFRRYAEHLGCSLDRKDFENFVPLLSGYPEQVTYAASLISELGPERAFKEAHEIVAFATFRAGIILRGFEERSDLIEFLRFISSFEFVSADFVLSIQQRLGEPLTGFLDELIASSVCEPIGSTGNYYRVNDVIRDTIIRDRYDIETKYREALSAFVDEFIKNSSEETFDISEYQIAIVEALASDREIPTQLLIPAHFLQTMRQLYFERNFKEVVILADRALQNRQYFDEHTEQDIRYYLCQCLARQSDRRFLQEVQNIKGPEHHFLLGFYYRVQRRFPDALKRFRMAMEHQRTEQRARREIVFVLTTIEAYDEAISLARENFERYPRNPYLAQAYFNCLLYQQEEPDRVAELTRVLKTLRLMPGERASEIHDNLAARYEYEFGDQAEAFRMIDQAIHDHSDIVYPLLTKLDLAVFEENPGLIEEALVALKTRGSAPGHTIAIQKAEAVLAALKGNSKKGLDMLDREFAELSDSARERFARKIRSITSSA